MFWDECHGHGICGTRARRTLFLCLFHRSGDRDTGSKPWGGFFWVFVIRSYAFFGLAGDEVHSPTHGLRKCTDDWRSGSE